MKQLISTLGDKIQATFPPNRVMILLAGPIATASLWLSAWATAHVPGANLPSGVIAGGMFLGGGIVVTVIYKWFDQWQRGESIDITGELSAMIDELETKFFSSLGAHEAVKHALADLHGQISRGEVNEAQVAHSIEALHGVVDEFLADQAPDATPSAPLPAAEAPLESPATPEPQAAPAAPETPAQ